MGLNKRTGAPEVQDLRGAKHETRDERQRRVARGLQYLKNSFGEWAESARRLQG